jgi:hypothetical protein
MDQKQQDPKQPQQRVVETKVEPGVVQIPCPNPSDEAARGTVKNEREMTMSIPVKGKMEEFTYIRRDM